MHGLSLTLFLHSTIAHGVACAPNSPMIEAATAVPEYVLKAGTVGPPDRKQAKDFAESGESAEMIEKRYAASGDLVCEKSELKENRGQAQVVVNGDTIITSAHVLYGSTDGKPDCEKAIEPSSCKLTLKVGGKIKAYDLEKELGTGFLCPDNSSTTDGNDWSILKLKTPVDSSITPYPLGTPPCASPNAPVGVVSVAKSNDFGPSKENVYSRRPRHYGKCQMHEGACGRDAKILVSDCDAAPSSSGGGMFIGGTSPVLVALHVSIRDECPQNARDKSGPYSKDCWSTVSVPISGKFLDKLREVTGG